MTINNINIKTFVSRNIDAKININITEDLAYGYGYGKLDSDFFHVFDINGELDGELLIPTSEIIGDDYWIWKNGSNSINQNATYPIGPNNEGNIGSKWSSCHWKDNDGNLWVFGGNSYTDIGGQGLTNDLWKYEISTKRWIWVRKYTVSPNGDYSAGLGNVSPNGPGKRSGACSWTDNSGMFWMFGGFGYGESASVDGYLNDLWQYNPNTNEWKWVAGTKTINYSGSYPPVHGGSGTPKGRYRSCSWTDNNGCLWMFGGNSGFINGICNDLWKFDISQNQWYFISGANGTTDGGEYPSSYGGVGTPCSRDEAGCCVDLDGNLWLFGGRAWGVFGHPLSYFGALNDLWKYSVNENQWYFIGGSQELNNMTTDFNTIPSRVGANMIPSTHDSLLLYSGMTTPSSSLGVTTYTDFWMYSISNNIWSRIRESETAYYPPAYEGEGFPPSRRQAAVWRNDDGNIYMFGGQKSDVSGTYNDLWEYRVTDKFLYGYGFEYTKNIINNNRSKLLNIDIVPEEYFDKEFMVTLRINGPGISNIYQTETINYKATFNLTDIKKDIDSKNTIKSLAYKLENFKVCNYGYELEDPDFFQCFEIESQEEKIANKRNLNYTVYNNEYTVIDKDTFFDVILEISDIWNEPKKINQKAHVVPNSNFYSKSITLKAGIVNG